MYTWRFLVVVGSTLLFSSFGAGDATAQMRRMSMPMNTVPVSVPSMLPMQPLTTVPPLYPNTGLSYPFSNAWLQGAYNPLSYPWLQGAYMPNGYGNSTPYIPPVLSSPGAYPTGVTSRMNDIVVKLPIANAKILINGVETNGIGSSTRHISVPDAPAGQKNEFTIKATWTIDGKTKSDVRTVPLNGSGRQVVNFLVPAGK
jgi:uncharacterized protein (TIGR03000 family)